MNVKIHFRNLEPVGNQEKLINRQSSKVRKLITNFPSEVVDLNVSVEKLSRGSQFQTALTLSLPQRVIRVDEIEDLFASPDLYRDPSRAARLQEEYDAVRAEVERMTEVWTERVEQMG